MSTDGRSGMKWAETYVSWHPSVLSVLRIMTGLLFLQYEMAKLLKFPAVPLFKDVTLFSLLGLAGTIELVGGVLVILGLQRCSCVAAHGGARARGTVTAGAGA